MGKSIYILFNVYYGPTSASVCVFLLRRYSFNKIFHKKFKDEEIIVKKFIEKKVYYPEDKNDVNLFKEKLINSCNLAASKF